MRRLLALAVVALPLWPADMELLEPNLVRQIENVEAAVDRSFRPTGTDRATAVGVTRGIYLPGYGAVFSVEVNLVPTANLSPFRRSYTAAEIQALNERKRQMLDGLRRTMRRLLVEEGPTLSDLKPDLQVALAVSLFHFPWEDRTGLPSQVVMGAARGDLSNESMLVTRHY